MPRVRLLTAACLLALAPVSAPLLRAADPAPIVETWEAAYLNGNRAGFVHFTAREIEADGRTVLRARKELSLSVRRGGDTAVIAATTGTDSVDGKVVGISMTQRLGSMQALEMVGTVVGKQIEVNVTGQPKPLKQPWDEAVLSQLGELNVLKDRKAKPGDEFSYRIFEPTVTLVVTVQVKVLKEEEVRGKDGKPRSLLRVEARPEEIKGATLPMTVGWYDPKSLEMVRSQTELPGLGTLVLERATKELATAAPEAGGGDLLRDQAIRLNKRLPRPDEIEHVVFRLQVPGVKESAKAFAIDGVRQKLLGYDDDSHVVDIKITPVRRPVEVKDPKEAAAEFLASNKFINCDDERVKKYAKQAVGSEKDPWKKATLIERWVRDNMRILNFTQAMATSDEVARTLEGDCTEFAMLTAAMCRAAGVPSRTAIGLVYVDRREAPELGWHMWTEVYVNGQWLGLDATIGMGGISAGHLKVTDHSWHETVNLTPLLPMMQIMSGKTRAEVNEIKTVGGK